MVHCERSLSVHSILLFLIIHGFGGFFFAKERVITYQLTTFYPNQIQSTTKIKEYYNPKKYALEKDGNLSIIRLDQQKIIWFFPQQEKRAERTFKEQEKKHQEWMAHMERELASWRAELKNQKLSLARQKMLRKLIEIQTTSYSLKEIGEEVVQNYPCIKYSVYWGKQEVGTIWVSTTLKWEQKIPFVLLYGPWDTMAQFKEKLTGPILKSKLSISPKSPLLVQELEFIEIEFTKIPQEKFDPIVN